MEEIDVWRSANVMLKYYGADANLLAIRQAAVVFAPRRLLREAEQIGPGDVMMADFRAAQPAEVAFRPIRSGTVKAVGFLMVDGMRTARMDKRSPGWTSRPEPESRLAMPNS